MTAESSRSFVEASLERAEKALKSAKLLEEDGELEDAVSKGLLCHVPRSRGSSL